MLSRTHSLPVCWYLQMQKKTLDTLYNTNQSEQRCKIMEDLRQKPFSFRITVINDEFPAVADEGYVLVILGLAKPYRGSSCQYTRWRCYILVKGVCSSLAAHILHCIFNSKFSQRVNTAVSWGRRIDLYFLVSTQMTLNLTQRLVFRSGKIEYLKGLRSWKKNWASIEGKIR